AGGLGDAPELILLEPRDHGPTRAVLAVGHHVSFRVEDGNGRSGSGPEPERVDADPLFGQGANRGVEPSRVVLAVGEQENGAASRTVLRRLEHGGGGLQGARDGGALAG